MTAPSARAAKTGVALEGPRGMAASRRARRARELRSEEHTSELQSRLHLVCRLLLEKKKKTTKVQRIARHGYQNLLGHHPPLRMRCSIVILVASGPIYLARCIESIQHLILLRKVRS